jgi:hypothetical protein
MNRKLHLIYRMVLVYGARISNVPSNDPGTYAITIKGFGFYFDMTSILLKRWPK